MGFAAEIKEFLGAAKDSWKLMSDTESKDADAKYKNTLAAKTQADIDNPLNDEEQKAKIAHLKASTANIGHMTPLQQLQYKLMLQAQNPPETGPSTVAAPPTNRPAVGAIPAPPKVNPDDDQGTGFARGGLVRKFAVGGMVDDSDLDDDDDEVTPGVMPPAIGPTDVSAQRRTAPAIGGVPTPAARPPNPVDDALKYGVTQLPPQTGAIGGSAARTRALRGYAQGAGGAPADEMLKVYRKIDPKGEMGESERNMYAIQSIWQYKMNQGDTEGAAKAAFQMLQSYKTAATRYAALADAAMKNGNVDEGMKLAMKAYAQVPDGNDMKLYKGKDGRIGYEMKDKDGNQITGGIATPAEIGAAAAKLATPGGYEQYLVQMNSGAKLDSKGNVSVGGAPAKKAKAADDEDAGPAKPKDYAATQEQIGTHVDNWVATQQKNDPNKKFEPEEIAAVKNAMYHIRRNNDLTDDEALTAARTYMSAPENKKGEKAPFKVIKDKDADEATIKYPDGRELTLPMKDYMPLAAMRGQRLVEQEKAKKKADEDAAKPTYGQMLGKISDKADETFLPPQGKEAAQAVGQAVGNLAGRAGAAISEDASKFGQETIDAAKKFEQLNPAAAAAIKRGAAGVSRAMTNPNDDEDRRVDAPL